MSSSAFLEWSHAQSGSERYELIDGHIVRLQAERLSHAHAKLQVTNALQRAADADGLPCLAMVDGASVVCGDLDVFIPDSAMQCTPIADSQSQYLDSPVVVVEILSESMSARDMSVKFRGYLGLDSVVHYLIVDIDAGFVIHHEKHTDHVRTTEHTDGSVKLTPPGLTLSIDDILSPLPI